MGAQDRPEGARPEEVDRRSLELVPWPRRLVRVDADQVLDGRVHRRLVWSEPCMTCWADIEWREWVPARVRPRRLAERRKLLCSRCAAKESRAVVATPWSRRATPLAVEGLGLS